jgi:hypothetical protein
MEGIMHKTWNAAADLSSAGQYRFVKLASASTINLAGAGESAIGILQNDPASGAGANVMVMGISNVVLGEDSVTVGARLKADASGDAVATTTDTEIYNAIALEAGDDGEIISCLICPGGPTISA